MGEYRGVGVEGRRGDLELLKGAASQMQLKWTDTVGHKVRDVPVETGSRHVGQQVAREDVLAAAAFIASEMHV